MTIALMKTPILISALYKYYYYYYNEVAFSTELLEWGCKFLDFWGKWEFKMGRFLLKK